ncbi:hypothetical protein AB1207_01705 [Kineococcus endophyticus]|uniref:Uncharacterized protein n=1 Tax=Kineococcus endophyticus TaxID=1181883 RepID=A0ABV3P1F2_9ACTN
MSRTPDDGSGPLDVDAAFAEIVAHWGDDAAAPERTEDARDTTPAEPTGAPDAGDPAGEDSPAAAEEATTATESAEDRSPRHRAGAEEPAESPEDRTRLVRPAAPLPPAPREDVPSPEWFATPRQRDDEPAELRALGEDRFVPADPSPLPRDVVGWAAWIAVVGSPLFLLVVALGWNDVPQLMTAITAAVFVAGFATLVIRLPSSRDDDDDDGAVV